MFVWGSGFWWGCKSRPSPVKWQCKNRWITPGPGKSCGQERERHRDIKTEIYTCYSVYNPIKSCIFASVGYQKYHISNNHTLMWIPDLLTCSWFEFLLCGFMLNWWNKPTGTNQTNATTCQIYSGSKLLLLTCCCTLWTCSTNVWQP